MHIHSGTPLARPPAARQSIGRVFGSGVVVLVDLITLVFLTFFDVIASQTLTSNFAFICPCQHEDLLRA